MGDMADSIEWLVADYNMLSADQHYSADRPSDYDFCDQCGREFNSEDPDGDMVRQHVSVFMLCESCAELLEDGA